ncbi:MAG: dethiobiotin synthase [Pseudomonadales bacterium]|nr:dethiobiotin synthase [Pseudomonadales bacterium]
MGLFSKKKKITRTYFITGTDTGVGKTLVCSALLEAVNKANLTSVALKPVAAGCEMTDQGPVNDDALELQSHMSVQLSYEDINPIALEPAIAPHIAAAEIDLNIDIDELAQHCQAMTNDADVMLIEGAGGWRVPLNEEQYMSDLVKALNVPVIIVVAMRLGCINHGLLTAEAIRADGLQVAGWVANCTTADNMPGLGDSLLALRDRMEAPFLGYLPYFEDPDPLQIAPYLEISYL